MIVLKIFLSMVWSTVSPSEMTCISRPSISFAASRTSIFASTQSNSVNLTIGSACLGMIDLNSATWAVKSFMDCFWMPLWRKSGIGCIAVLIRTKRPSISSESRVQPSSSEWERPLMIPTMALNSGLGLYSCSFSSRYIWSCDSTLNSLSSGPNFWWQTPIRCQIVPLTDALGRLSLISSSRRITSSLGCIKVPSVDKL